MSLVKSYKSRSDVETLVALMGYKSALSNGIFSTWSMAKPTWMRNKNQTQTIIKIYARTTKVSDHVVQTSSAGGNTFTLEESFSGPHDEAIEYLIRRRDERQERAGRAAT